MSFGSSTAKPTDCNSNFFLITSLSFLAPCSRRVFDGVSGRVSFEFSTYYLKQTSNMVDVIDSNFEEIFPNFEHQLKKCSFVALDCEFTSLPFDEDTVPSFQDSGSERYKKICQTIIQCFPLQVGVSHFTYDRDLVEYKATIFKFYICPKFFGLFDLNINFKSSSVQFLRTYNFDFNKVFYHGIPYLNKAQSEIVSEQMKNGILPERIYNILTFDEREALADHYETIRTWLHRVDVGETLTIQVGINCPHIKYFLHKDIRKCFKTVWTFHSTLSSPELTVKRVSEEERLSLQATTESKIDEELLMSLRGFTRVLEALIISKKPIVGHNMLIDLLSCYHHYYLPLPGDYDKFKTNLNSLFPVLYDTKFISHEMKRMHFRDVLDNVSLQNLFMTFQDKKDNEFKPKIVLESGIHDEVSEVAHHAHDAGWDAFMTGFCFLKMMNLLKVDGKKSYVHCSNTELMNVAVRFKNKVNIGRAFVPYLQLDGPDPLSSRPPHLVVSYSNRSRLNFKQLDSLLLEVGTFEVRPLSLYAATVAAPNYHSYDDAIKKFSKMNDFRVEKYSLLRHHKWVRSFFIVGCILPASMTVWYYLKR
ncbi:hypothetical protein GE061_002086 [Apolygus lucorum]|uniref:Uncharacterized protein n=1 Tax=Apolygus lucorum TaxID=248454 RepID=A0A6A4J665_APOLU|nr:hypothetical protein GE061_002086 [Apolygus lucorum]